MHLNATGRSPARRLGCQGGDRHEEKPWNATRNSLDSIEEQIPAKPTKHFKNHALLLQRRQSFHRNRRRTTKGNATSQIPRCHWHGESSPGTSICRQREGQEHGQDARRPTRTHETSRWQAETRVRPKTAPKVKARGGVS